MNHRREILTGIFAALILLGKRYGVTAVLGLSVVLIILQSIFILLALGQIIDPGMHDPLDNWWATLLRYLFSILTLALSIKAYRETKQGHSNI